MKTFKLLGFMAVLAAGFSASAFAEQVQGEVKSVDSANRSIVIGDPVSGKSRTVGVPSNVASDVKAGDPVKATLSADGTKADTLEVLVTR